LTRIFYTSHKSKIKQIKVVFNAFSEAIIKHFKSYDQILKHYHILHSHGSNSKEKRKETGSEPALIRSLAQKKEKGKGTRTSS
jgi:hypothetical protein